MTVRTLFYAFSISVLTFAVLSWGLEPKHVFHVITAMALSGVAMVGVAYWPGVTAAWRQRECGITTAHLVPLGIVTATVGFIIRIGRWYITASTPTAGIEQWAYNVGLWITMTSACILIAGVALSDPIWPRSTWIRFATVFWVLTLALWALDYFWKGFPHMGPIPAPVFG